MPLGHFSQTWKGNYTAREANFPSGLTDGISSQPARFQTFQLREDFHFLLTETIRTLRAPGRLAFDRQRRESRRSCEDRVGPTAVSASSAPWLTAATMEDHHGRLRVSKEIAQALLSAGIEDVDTEPHPAVGALAAMATAAAAKPAIPFPAGFAPTLEPIVPAPDSSAALPKADVIVVTWTIDEQDALADVLTPGVSRAHWYRYNRNFSAFDPLFEQAPRRRSLTGWAAISLSRSRAKQSFASSQSCT